MFEYAEDIGLKFARPLTPQDVVNMIVCHMSGSDRPGYDARAIHEDHIGRGWKGVAYNAIIEYDGRVVKGRWLGYEGGHVANDYYRTADVNARSFGICVCGNLQKHPMTPQQYESLKQLVADLYLYDADPRFNLKSVTQLTTHNLLTGTAYTDCPGVYFPITPLRDYIRNYDGNKVDPVEVIPDPIDEMPSEIPEVIENPIYTYPGIRYPVVIMDPFAKHGVHLEAGGAQGQAIHRPEENS